MDTKTVFCFRCGKLAVGMTPIGTGTKDGVVLREKIVAVYEDCYAVLKEKVRTRSRLSDEMWTLSKRGFLMTR